MLDHLVYAVPDVQAACDDLEARLGVRPTLGGRFVQMASYNHLLSLGGGAYLEVIGPDPTADDPGQPRPFGIDDRSTPGLVTWAAKATNLSTRVVRAREGGFDLGEARPLSRQLPDGTSLEWELTMRSEPMGPDAGLVPFLIDWGESRHPSQTAAKGCQLVEFHGEHPDPESVMGMLEAVGEPINVTLAAAPAMIATIQGPKGQIELR